jgi:hypothetical protein
MSSLSPEMLMATRKPPSLVNAVSSGLRSAPTSKADSGAIALVKRYAWMIEEAAEIAEAASLLEPEDSDTAELIRALTRRVEAMDVLANLGPKLLAGLTELGMTSKAMAAVVGKVRGGGSGDDSAGSKRASLHALRTKSDKRLGGAG